MSFSFNYLPNWLFMDTCSGEKCGGGTPYGHRWSLLLYISCAMKPASGYFSAGLCLLLLQPQSTSWVSLLPLASGSVKELLTATDEQQPWRPSRWYDAVAVAFSSVLCLTLAILLPVSFWPDCCPSLHIGFVLPWAGASPPSQQMRLQQCCGHLPWKRLPVSHHSQEENVSGSWNRQLSFFSVLGLGKYPPQVEVPPLMGVPVGNTLTFGLKPV